MIATNTASSLVAGKGVESMSEESVEFVVSGDCSVDGEAFLVGEVRTVPKSVYRALLAAGRVCKDPELAEILKAERARSSAPAEDPATAEAKAKAGKGKG